MSLIDIIREFIVLNKCKLRRAIFGVFFFAVFRVIISLLVV